MTRLKSKIWLDALCVRLRHEMIPYYFIHTGESSAGIPYILTADNVLYGPEYDFAQDHYQWAIMVQGAQVPAFLDHLDKTDPDHWVLEIETIQTHYFQDMPL